MGICGGSLFNGNNNQYIKFQGSDIIAVSGMNTVDRLLMGDVRIPYKQLLKSRVILKPGQVNYLLNHLGLGDNATFLAIKATYNSASVNEDRNYIEWNFFDDPSHKYPMGRVMILTGNSNNRLKQIYLSNPNTNYPVVLDIMVGAIDDEYSFFPNTVNQIGLSFVGLSLDSFETYVIDQSIVIYDNNTPRGVLAYLGLTNISSVQLIGKLLVVEDAVFSTIFMDFISVEHAKQTQSMLNYVMSNSGISIQNLSPKEDIEPPIIYFHTNLGGTFSGATISYSGTSSLPVDSSMWGVGETFSVTLDSDDYTLPLSKESLIDLLIDSVNDNRDGTMSFTASSLTLVDPNLDSQLYVTSLLGTWSVGFVYEDIAGNTVPNIEFNLFVQSQ